LQPIRGWSKKVGGVDAPPIAFLFFRVAEALAARKAIGITRYNIA
jgi:hypothetical protein